MINATTHPWVRFGATSLDFALVNLCLAAAEAARGGPLFPQLSALLQTVPIGLVQRLASMADTVIPCLLAAAVEAVLLCTVGTTPGKALMGLELRRADGAQKLTPAQSAARAAGKFVYGNGLGIALVSAIAQIRSFNLALEGKPLHWEADHSYQMKERSSGARIAAYLIAAVVIGVPMFWLRSLTGGGA